MQPILSPSTQDTTLASLIAQLATRNAERHAEAARCWTKAARIATTGSITPRGAAPRQYAVQSGSDPSTFYDVDLIAKTCTCPDAVNRQRVCCHQRAVRLLIAAGRELADGRRALDYDEPVPYELTPRGLAVA
jgi:hypothetical protein